MSHSTISQLNKPVLIVDDSGQDGSKNDVDHTVGRTTVWAWKEASSHIGHHDATDVLPNQFVKYGNGVSDEIELWYRKWKNKSGNEIIDIDLNGISNKVNNAKTGLQYRIDFRRMVQINSTSGYEREIIRQDVPAVPRTWTDGVSCLVGVQPGSNEWSDVHGYFVNNMSQGTTIIGIERVQNKDKWDMYQAMKNVMLRKYHSQSTLHHNSTSNLERPKLFHGTDPATASKILKQGFNRTFTGRNGSTYGKGVYFAVSPQTSARYATQDSSSRRKMFLCRVIVGDFCLGKSGQSVPDVKPGTNDELFDTTVNDVNNPTIFVTFHDAQAYPEYLITFK